MHHDFEELNVSIMDRDQPPKIHDIKLMFHSNLHNALLKLNYVPESSNKRIPLEIPTFNNNIIIKIQVYPKTIQIDIGCTYKPFVYDISVVIHLTHILGRVCQYIESLTISNFLETDAQDF